MQERQMMGKQDMEYQRFVNESVQDSQMDKQLDMMIDEMIGQGEGKFTDQQIIEQISQKAGLSG